MPSTPRKYTNRTGRRRARKPPPSPREGSSPPEEPRFTPRINPKLVPILEHIGVPGTKPFVPDPFQLEAVEKLAHSDVVVSAPTGSGKTWIAEEAIKKVLARGQRAWYASPLKALSNSKFADFKELFGDANVGILTGDRKENLGAPLIVGTTEILRNQLYDAMYRGADLAAGLVVLDEAHFLGDPERGVVWEEVIIYLPVRVRLLLLSATVANADQIARWLTFVRAEPAVTVYSDERPVPLYPVFLFPDGELAPLKTRRGMFGKVRHFVESQGQERGYRPASWTPPFGQVLSALEEADMLPSIFFLKSRADCDNALGHVASSRLRVDAKLRRDLNTFIDGYLKEYPFLERHPQLEVIRRLHVAPHHAGHLLHWKLLVESLMQRGLLKAIFSTSTVAAGVNFPARTVVITQSDRFDGREFVDLSATDLLQMTGRAGRRGMDNIGFALVVPGPYQNVPLVAALLDSEPEPIESRLSINFSMVLNLLLSQRPSEVKQLLGYSLATFQRLERSGGRKSGGDSGLGHTLKNLGLLLADSGCPGPEEAVIRRRRSRQLRAMHENLARELKSIEERQGLWAALTRGRVFMDMFGSLAAVMHRESHGDQVGVLSVSLDQDRRLQRGRPRLDFVPLNEVAGAFQEVLDLPRAGGGRMLAQAVLNQIPARPTPLAGPDLADLGRQEVEELRSRLTEVEDELGGLTCGACASAEECHHGQGELGALLNKAEGILNLVQEESHAFWYDFVRHLEFLRSEGFVDASGALTQDGQWASKLRLDQPVLIAEAIRREALTDQDPVLLAALLALFVDDRDREVSPPYLSQRLKDGITGLQWTLDGLLNRLRQWGFSTPPMPLNAAAAVFAWGLGAEFEDAVVLYGGAEGDLASLIYRTADNLRQIISLADTHPRLVSCAREAVELLLRPPVVVPM
ncbi:MAG: DEAD/DEAH box helicase [Deltaproteobacteria bacterium]|nr:DEAD/DEAH box helicase [Deltaproteobacteria bacterium]